MRWIFILLSLMICFGLVLGNYKNQSALYDLTFLIIAIWSLLAIFNKRNVSFSLYKIFYMFVFLFFAIAPYMQFANGTIFWIRSGSFFNSDYEFTNIIILSILVVFEICYTIMYRFFMVKSEKRPSDHNKVISSKTRLLLLFLSLISLIITLYSKNWNLIPLFLRGGDFLENNDVSSMDQIYNNYFRPLSFIIFLFYYHTVKRFDFFGIIFLTIAIFCNFPTGIARYNAAALYIPFLLVVLPRIRLKYYFNLILLLGFLIIFPFLNNFRNVSDKSDFKFGFDFEMFTEGHFDSYSSLLRVMKYDIFTMGNQLLGVILFWVPRENWSGKPIGSGAFMAKELGLSFSNISANFFAEGYINFGFIGIYVFAILLAFTTSFFDKKYVSLKKNGRCMQSNDFDIFYFLLCGFIIFILRGDLLSSFAYASGFLSAAFTATYIIKKTKKNEN